MPSIYDDIQALRERFRREFGIEASVRVYAFTTNNRKPSYIPGKVAVDLAAKGGVPAWPEIMQHEDTAWIDLTTARGEAGVTLFY